MLVLFTTNCHPIATATSHTINSSSYQGLVFDIMYLVMNVFIVSRVVTP